MFEKNGYTELKILKFSNSLQSKAAEPSAQILDKNKEKTMEKKRFIEIAVKVVVAALTAFLTAITTTSCMGHGPIAF